MNNLNKRVILNIYNKKDMIGYTDGYSKIFYLRFNLNFKWVVVKVAN